MMYSIGGGARSIPHQLTITGALVVAQRAAGGAITDTLAWNTATIPTTQRLAAIRCDVGELLDFATPDASWTIWAVVQNDNGDELFRRAVDVAHGTTTISGGVGALPLAVGPGAAQSLNPYRIFIVTDAEDVALVSGDVGSVSIELLFEPASPARAINPTP
jgi:hypothetical protein